MLPCTCTLHHFFKFNFIPNTVYRTVRDIFSLQRQFVFHVICYELLLCTQSSRFLSGCVPHPAFLSLTSAVNNLVIKSFYTILFYSTHCNGFANFHCIQWRYSLKWGLGLYFWGFLTFKRPSLNTSHSPYGPTLNSAFSFEAYAFG
jgi:hypothetical protein